MIYDIFEVIIRLLSLFICLEEHYDHNFIKSGSESCEFTTSRSSKS